MQGSASLLQSSIFVGGGPVRPHETLASDLHSTLLMPFDGPRERLLEKGATSLTDLELLSVILRTGSPSKAKSQGPKVLELAQGLLDQFGDMRGVFGASLETLEKVSGLGPAKIGTIAAVREIACRLWAPPDKDRFQVRSVQGAYALFSDLSLETQEVLAAAFLTNQNRLIKRQNIFRGTLDGSLARPREILFEALRANAAKILLAHNHPSQEPEPSAEDIRFTEQMEWLAQMMGIPLVDHLIICGEGRYYSFAGAKRLGLRHPERGRRRENR